MTWTLFGLAKNPEVQRKLREELLALPTDDPTMDDLKSLPYLDMVIREALRLYAPVHSTARVAMKDTVLPMKDGTSIRCVLLQHPNANVSLSGSDLTVYKRNSMAKGDGLLIPIYAMNTDKDIWGADALEFKYTFNRNLLLLETDPDSPP